MSSLSEKRRAEREILKLPYLVLSVSILLTVGATYLFYQNARAKDLTRFQGEVESVNNRIESLINNYISSIKSGRAFIHTTENLNRPKFAEFVKNLDLANNYSGIKSLGFSKRILPEERESLIRKMNEEGYADFKIFPDSSNPESEAIIYIEPSNEANRRAIGYDMSTETTRRQALERARDTGEAAATGKVFLIQETDSEKQAGFLIYLSVYKGGVIPESVEDRRRLLDGYVYSPFRAGNFLSDVQKSISVSDVAFAIYENDVQPENLLAVTNQENLTDKADYEAENQINVAGRKWILQSRSLPSFKLQSNTNWTLTICFCGIVFSLLLFGMTYLEAYARSKAEAMTGELRASEKEKAFLLESEQFERKRAEEANRAKDEFLSIVSHELRTPLNAIAGWSKILSTENLSEPIKKQALQKIDKNLRIQTKIVEELLDFSSIISDKNSLRREELDFSALFEETCSQTEPLAKQKGIELEKENLLNGKALVGDSERLKRVVKNLLSNAIKFTPQGGKVFAGVREDHGAIELVVKDTGQGIKKAELQHIFEHFKQGDSSITRKHGGLGIGLSVSRHIIKLHGGSIDVKSDGEGKGAQFTVRLPYKS